MTTPILSVRNAVKRYGQVHALDHVDLDVADGEFLTLLGPSGSGKTTLLSAIAGFIRPDEGSIHLRDREITAAPPEQRDFGMVFQGYALFPTMTVRDNVAFPLKVRRRPADEIAARVTECLALVQMEQYADRMPQQLSGGQQQRVALARALSFKPQVLLLDEPLSALDKKLRADLQTELKDLHRRVGLTFIYVTHDQDEALSMSDQVAIMRDGRLAQFGSPENLYEKPRTRFVADFLGKSNFLHGRAVERREGGFAYECGGVRLIQAQAGGSPAPGEPVAIALRPEKIEVGSDVKPATANLLEGTIADCTYLGTDFRLTVEADGLPPGERNMLVTVPAWRCHLVPEPGRRVFLGWDAEASTLVAED